MDGAARKRRIASRSQQRALRRRLEQAHAQLLRRIEREERRAAPPLPVRKDRAKPTPPQIVSLMPFSPIEDPIPEVIHAAAYNKRQTLRKLLLNLAAVAREWIAKTYVFFTLDEVPEVGWELDFPVTRKNLMVMTSLFIEFESTRDATKHIGQLYDIVNTRRSARARRAWVQDLHEIGL